MAKRISLYGILAALCLVLSYVEHLIPLSFVAPGVKIGLANSVALILIAKADIKGAFAVNLVRILLSALLFAAPSTLIFSLSGGILSIVVMWGFSSLKGISIIGFSIAGATVHNLAQLVVAALLLGQGVWYYAPLLILSALLSGVLTGTVANLIFKRLG